MTNAPWTSFLGCLRRLAERPETQGLGDGDLLRRFSAQGDGEAFAAVLRRHGPMVLGVCRRALGDAHHAEDAFQATFLVLTRQARSLGAYPCVGGWLHVVARRVAHKARAALLRQARAERQAAENAPMNADPTEPGPALGESLDRELGRLPMKYRLPLILCYLEGKTAEEAARQLGLSLGTLRGRLFRGRERLRRRLAPDLPGVVFVEVSPALFSGTLGAAVRFAAGKAAAGGLAAAPVALAKGVLRTMLLTKLTVWAAVLAGGLGVGVPLGAWAFSGAPGGGSEVAAPAAKAPAAKKPEPALTVRHLKAKDVPFALRGGNKVKVAKNLAELEKLVGKALAAQLAPQVNFAKEDVVYLGWEAGGPPFPPLKHAVKGKGKDRVVEFYTEAPDLKPGEARNLALKVAADFFAVPKGTPVKDVGERKAPGG